jgi:hypothetical protein
MTDGLEINRKRRSSRVTRSSRDEGASEQELEEYFAAEEARGALADAKKLKVELSAEPQEPGPGFSAPVTAEDKLAGGAPGPTGFMQGKVSDKMPPLLVNAKADALRLGQLLDAKLKDSRVEQELLVKRLMEKAAAIPLIFPAIKATFDKEVIVADGTSFKIYVTNLGFDYDKIFPHLNRENFETFTCYKNSIRARIYLSKLELYVSAVESAVKSQAEGEQLSSPAGEAASADSRLTSGESYDAAVDPSFLALGEYEDSEDLTAASAAETVFGMPKAGLFFEPVEAGSTANVSVQPTPDGLGEHRGVFMG